MSNYRHATHDAIAPVADGNSKILFLGSIPSPKSVEHGFYYAHPQNRFWRVLAEVLGESFPATTDERKKLALDHGVALWDVLQSCDIDGASDSSIKNAVFNDIDGFLKSHPNIERVFTTGGKAHELLKKYNKTVGNGIISSAVRLPSTSPLNCATTAQALVTAYSVITQNKKDG